MTREDYWGWVIIILVLVAMAGVLMGLTALGSYLAYGDVSCAFAHCVKVVR